MKGLRKLYGGLAGLPAQAADAIERRMRYAEDATEEATRQARAFPENAGRRVKNIKVDHKRAGGVNSATITIPHKLARPPTVVRPLTSTNETLGRYRVVQRTARALKVIISESTSGSLDFWVS